jgi:hypothetical protein
MMPMHIFGPSAQNDLSRSLEKALKLVKSFLICGRCGEIDFVAPGIDSAIERQRLYNLAAVALVPSSASTKMSFAEILIMLSSIVTPHRLWMKRLNV